ncbi:MAG: hypothetical protein IJO60_08835 [Agathobacter sp.]|nr:hypothetical protein [Agathobacter sp.]
MISINSKDELSLYNLEGKWNDYIAVQKEVLRVLREEKFFENSYINNEESQMCIRLTTKGIRETLGNGNRFKSLPKRLKVCKVSTIRSLREIIKSGHLIEDNVENIHNEGYLFAYICNEVLLDGERIRIRIAVKKKISTNYFWIHNVDEY